MINRDIFRTKIDLNRMKLHRAISPFVSVSRSSSNLAGIDNFVFSQFFLVMKRNRYPHINVTEWQRQKSLIKFQSMT